MKINEKEYFEEEVKIEKKYYYFKDKFTFKLPFLNALFTLSEKPTQIEIPTRTRRYRIIWRFYKDIAPYKEKWRKK